jgi:hypothetical protein
LERGLRALALLLVFFSEAALCQSPNWLLVSESGRAEAGTPFQLVLAGPEGAALPEEIGVRVRIGVAETDLKMQAASPAENGRRRYAAVMPASAGGPVALRVADPPSNVVVLIVVRSDAVQSLTGAAAGEQEPPLSENEPMYFVVGARERWTARFQISFKYRLFDYDAGFGKERPWLTGLYFAYTQTSLWDLEGESAPFFDTSYRPSLFWRWLRTDQQTWIDGVRIGVEHESNGQSGIESRSINHFLFLNADENGRIASTQKLRGDLEQVTLVQSKRPRALLPFKSPSVADRRSGEPDQRTLPRFHSDRHRANLFLKDEPFGVSGDETLVEQHEARADRRVTGESQFPGRCEYTNIGRAVRASCWTDEGRFRKIQLSGDLLHSCVVNSRCFRAYRHSARD